MDNPFIAIVRAAYNNDWCTKPYCTTCGAREYRQELRKLGGDLGGNLANALSELNPTELTEILNWQDALLLALMNLSISGQLVGVLDAWLPKINDDISFTDFVLYKVVRRLPTGHETRNRWIDNCSSLAISSKSFSLIESLILVLGRNSLEHQELIDLAKGYAKHSNQMRRVLRNVCGLKIETT